jgi:hypothetical protein
VNRHAILALRIASSENATEIGGCRCWAEVSGMAETYFLGTARADFRLVEIEGTPELQARRGPRRAKQRMLKRDELDVLPKWVYSIFKAVLVFSRRFAPDGFL